MKARLISEKFEESSDPIHDLGIGGVILNDEFYSRKQKLKKDQKKLLDDSNKKWEVYLRKILVGKTITGEMLRLTTFSKDMKQKIHDGKIGKFTIKVVDVKADSLEDNWIISIIIASDEHMVYKLKLTEKIYIRE